jgi:hypothetical protein
MHFPPATTFVTLYGSPPWNIQLRLKGIHDTEADNFDKVVDNTALVGVLLSVKHHSASQSSQANVCSHGRGNNGNRQYNMRNLRYNPGNVRYDRIFTFADLNTPGKCFAMITETVNEMDHLLWHLRESAAIGNIVALVEPEAPTKALNDMPLLSTIVPLVPIQVPTDLPSVPLVTPQPGQQRYFLLMDIQVRLSHVNVVPASCKGTPVWMPLCPQGCRHSPHGTCDI